MRQFVFHSSHVLEIDWMYSLLEFASGRRLRLDKWTDKLRLFEDISYQCVAGDECEKSQSQMSNAVSVKKKRRGSSEEERRSFIHSTTGISRLCNIRIRSKSASKLASGQQQQQGRRDGWDGDAPVATGVATCANTHETPAMLVLSAGTRNCSTE